jgi:hypothetical protein
MQDVTPFKYVVQRKHGTLDEDLAVGGEQWGLSEPLGARIIKQWSLWKDHTVRDWLERGRDTLERDFSFADGQFAVVNDII